MISIESTDADLSSSSSSRCLIYSTRVLLNRLYSSKFMVNGFFEAWVASLLSWVPPLLAAQESFSLSTSSITLVSSCSMKLTSGVSTRIIDLLSNRPASLTCFGDTSSRQCSLAMASDNLIKLSSCLTVILHDERATPELSLSRILLYSSTIYSSDSGEIFGL